MDSEKLKVIAEGMGWTDMYISGGISPLLLGVSEDCWMEEEYTPLHNNDQMVEIMEKLDIFTSTDEDGTKLASCPPHSGRMICEGKTINEAVCNAAYEYFK